MKLKYSKWPINIDTLVVNKIQNRKITSNINIVNVGSSFLKFDQYWLNIDIYFKIQLLFLF